MTKSRSPTTVPKSSRPSESRDGLIEFDLPTAFYMSEGRLCARFPYCPHRGWVRGELETDADQADYVCYRTDCAGEHVIGKIDRNDHRIPPKIASQIKLTDDPQVATSGKDQL